MSPEEEPEYQTPPTCDLLSLLLKNRCPSGAVNEVWPNLYVGDAATAQHKALLVSLGITHVVNAADGRQHIDTGPRFYHHTNIQYHGVEAADSKDFDLSPFFAETADFIQDALSQKGKVLVHCARGVSRSAALTLAYLMIKQGLTVAEAVDTVRRHRNILPNVGFLNQLRLLDSSLALQRRTSACGEKQTAKDKSNLKRLGITHILNAAEGTWNNVDTTAGYYSDMAIVYYGVTAEDVTTFDLSQYFLSAARFIEETLRIPQ